METKSNILGMDFDYSTIHLGLKYDESFWLYDEWKVTINGEVFDFKTGMGNRKPVSKFKQEKSAFYKMLRMRIVKSKESHDKFIESFQTISKPVKPEIDDVLYCLVMDCSACDMSFDDWCFDFGYDTDSRKALETYLTCQNNGTRIRKLGINISDAMDKFSDY